MKNHNRESFFKYFTADTLKKVLETQRFRWSAPKRFNDPFDHLFMISDEDSPDEHKAWFLAETEKIVFSTESPQTSHPSIYSAGLIRLRRFSNKMNRADFRAQMELAFEEGKMRAIKYLDSVNKEWEQAIETARIFCVSEEPQNLLMWAHYGGEHSGAVIELKCIEDFDTPLCAARKVEYRSKMPKLGSFKEMFLNGLGQAPTPTNEKLYYDLAFVKSENWAYEQEWRCITYRNEPGDYSDYKFYPDEIANVYLGCRMKHEDKFEILQIIKKHYVHAAVFQMKVDKQEYRLLSEKIDC